MITLLQLGTMLGQSFHPASGASFPALPISGVHVSELEDPTPYLDGGELLLTTGMPFASSPQATSAYFARLASHGLKALGLGLGDWLEQVPEYVSSEARRWGIQLGVVPDSVPFQAVSRAFWTLSARSTASGLMESLGTQTALARAANRPDAEESVIRQLAQALGGWAAHLDTEERTAFLWPQERRDLLPRVRGECRRFHRVDTPSAATFELDGQPVVIYPILTGNRLDGYLAVGAGRQVTKADRQVMMTVATLLSIRARQRQAESATALALGSVVAKLLLCGEHHAARLVADELGVTADLEGPVRLLAIDHPEGEISGVLREASALLPGGAGAEGAGKKLELAFRKGGVLYVIVPDGLDTAPAFAPPARPVGTLRAALSEPLDLPEIPGQLSALRSALAHATPGTVAAADHGAGQRAAGWVRLLRDHRRSDLFGAVRAYLAARGTWEEAARSLGIHRNSLRLRIGTAQDLLGVDLDDPDVAAELWLAIRDADD